MDEFPPTPVRHLPTNLARSAQLLRPCPVLRFPFLETDAWGVSIWMTNHVSYFSYRKSHSTRITTDPTEWHETKQEFHFEDSFVEYIAIKHFRITSFVH